MINYSSQSNIIKSIFLLLSSAILLNACREAGDRSSNTNNKDEQKVELLRFEQDLFKSEPKAMDSTLVHLKSKYDSFFDVYFLQIMNLGNPKTPGFSAIIADYIQNKDYKMLLHDCDSIYNEKEINKIQTGINNVFQQYQKIYPDDTLPKVTTFISGFGNGIVTTDGYIGIGLDLFLGADYRFYPSLDLPEYLTCRYTPNHLLPMFVKGMASYKYPFEKDKPLLIDAMLNEGKMLYFMSKMLPDMNDTLIIGYSKQQYEWCKTNEANIYQLLIQDGLYSGDFLKYRKYTEEAPFTVNLTNDSAPRIAWFAGWQVIKNFMKNNPDYSLDDLMKEKDSQKILSLSKYKP